ncbi:TraR/DksA C4-type zinc finger protein [Acetobacteraceae bacterium]|nr:TraR/DksA C4-type zinc finger protein [Candidatus Parcubacteria bacterium]
MNTEHFKEKLEAEFKSVETELKSVGTQNPENPADWEAKETKMDTATPMADANEAADKLEEYTQNRAINDTLEVRYNEIKTALDKISNGQYGVCEIGGEPIEEARLEADPAARTCKAHM